MAIYHALFIAHLQFTGKENKNTIHGVVWVREEC